MSLLCSWWSVRDPARETVSLRQGGFSVRDLGKQRLFEKCRTNVNSCYLLLSRLSSLLLFKQYHDHTSSRPTEVKLVNHKTTFKNKKQWSTQFWLSFKIIYAKHRISSLFNSRFFFLFQTLSILLIIIVFYHSCATF